MATNNPITSPLTENPAYASDTSDDAQAHGERRGKSSVALATRAADSQSESSLNQPAGQLLKGAVTEEGKQKDAALLVGIKLDLDAEIHLTARVRGDITIGLY